MKKSYLRSSIGLSLLLAVFVLGMLLGPIFSRTFSSPVEAAANAVYDRDTIADIAEAAAPAIVGITAVMPAGKTSMTPQEEEFYRWFFNMPNPGGEALKPKERRGFGTGFIVRPDGYILTNAHVVENAAKVTVRLQNSQTELPAKVVGQSSLLDLALLKIETKKDLPVLILGDSRKLRPGNWVVAIGNPLGYDHTVTAGVISAVGRRGVTAGGTNGEQLHRYDELLQTDVAINPGNSGGPLLDLDGHVIGINAVVSAVGQGIGFAIPINSARDALDQLIKTGRYVRPWLGVMISDLGGKLNDEELKKKYRLPSGDGVFIEGVVEGSPAEKEGLAKGDVITAVDGKAVRGADELIGVIRNHKVGDRVKLTVVHWGKTFEVELTLAEQPEE